LQKWVYYTKSFEYLASNTPFIATWWYWWDVIENLLKKTKWWYYCIKVKDTEDAIFKYYSEWEKNWYIEYKWINHEIDKFNYKNTTKNLTRIFDNFTN